jgi:hypothetical protein
VKRTVGRLLLLVTRHSFLVTLLAVALLGLGARCRLGLRDEGPTLPPRPKRFCKTLVIEYRRPKPPDVPEGGWRCLTVWLVEFRPGQGTVETILYTNISPDPNRPCLAIRIRRTSFGSGRTAGGRPSGTSTCPTTTNTATSCSSAIRPSSGSAPLDGIILPPEVSTFRRGSYKGEPALIFHLKEEGRCVAG